MGRDLQNSNHKTASLRWNHPDKTAAVFHIIRCNIDNCQNFSRYRNQYAKSDIETLPANWE